MNVSPDTAIRLSCSLAQGFQLVLGSRLPLKSGQAQAIRRGEALPLIEVHLIAQPLVIVRTLPGQDDLFGQPQPCNDEPVPGHSQAGWNFRSVDLA